MGLLQGEDDPLLERVPLDRYGPFAFHRDQPLTFRDANGIHWLLLDSVFTGRPGHDRHGCTVHLVRPADLDLGGGMDVFAEDLAERIRETDPDAVAIFSYWPREAIGPAEPASQVRWLSFSETHSQRDGGLDFDDVALGPTSMPGRGAVTLQSHTGHGGPSRYTYPSLWHLSFGELSELLGVQVEPEASSEVQRKAAAVPGWDVLARATQRANAEADEAFLAQLREWGVDDQ